MRLNRTAFAGLAAASVFIAGGAIGSQLATETTEVAAVEGDTTCDATGTVIDTGACGAQGVLLNGMLYNMQGAVQFCKWRNANPGEWSRLKAYLADPKIEPPSIVITWFGAALRDSIQAYALTYGKSATMPTPAPNACTGKLIKPPLNLKVTP